MGKQTISKLLSEAAKLLRHEFEFIRTSSPHPGEKGEEAEIILKNFLNLHLPQRFRASSGILIDNENNISRQTDVIIYDVLSSPIYRHSEKTQIIPFDTVAAVIEVKSCLNKNEIKDAFDKIVSCKKLKKRPLSQLDQRPTGSKLTTIGTFGIIFGFDSDTKLETLAENIKEFNKDYESKLWPDMVIVLDKGVINYGISYPGEMDIAGALAPLCDDKFPVPPFYVNLIVHKDEEFSLNRFFSDLLSHLTFYPRRPSTPPFELILEGTTKKAMTITGYQFNMKRELKTVPPEMYKNPKPPISMKVDDSTSKQIGIMQFIPWQDGSVIRSYGAMPLGFILSIIFKKEVKVIEHSGAQLSLVLKITEEDFRKWPEILSERTLMTGSIK